VINIDSLTLFPKLFKGENEHLPHYLHNYLREITNIHHIISKTIQGREPTSTTLFTKLFPLNSFVNNVVNVGSLP
jgi:hypothetical protein